MSMRFEALGPLRVLDDDRDVTPAGRIPRVLLAVLVSRANQAVSPGALAEFLWPGEVDVKGRFHVAVNRVRKILDTPERLTLGHSGYRLDVAEHESDVATFDRLAAALLVDTGDPLRTVRNAREALGLWRGDPFEGMDDVVPPEETRRWIERRQVVEEVLFETEVAAGRAREILPEIEAAAVQRPLDERLQALLVRALYAAGRSAEALEAFGRTSTVLREELGLDPGPELRELQAKILNGEVPEGRPSQPVTPAQLPTSVDLVGRDAELESLDALIDDGARICLIVGTPGSGKTSLAVQWGSRNLDRFPDGQLFVDLRGFSADAPATAPGVIASFLRGLGHEGRGLPTDEEELSALLRSHLAGRRVLLVLDNARSAEQVRPLLPGAADGCVVLITSRESLTGLAAREGARSLPVGRLEESAGLALLTRYIGDRVVHEPDAAAELVRRCASLPLALRVAAEQVRAHPGRRIADLVEDLADEHQRLDRLDTGDGAVTDVRAVLSWSYESLPEDAARTFRHLGLVPGRDIDAYGLAALCGTSVREARRDVDRLIRGHLVEELPGQRLTQHDLLKAYAAEGIRLLETQDDIRAARARLLAFYAAAALAADAQHERRRMDARLPASDWELPPIEDAKSAMDWIGYERRNLLALALTDEEHHPDHMAIIAKFLAQEMFDVPGDALALQEAAGAAARRAGDRQGVAMSESSIAVIHGQLGELDPAMEHLELAREAFRDCGDEVGETVVLVNTAVVAMHRGELKVAAQRIRTGIDFFRQQDSSSHLPQQLCNLSTVLLQTGDRSGARVAAEEAVEISRPGRMGDQHHAFALCALSRSRVADGDPALALRLAEEAVAESMDRAPGQLSGSLLSRARAKSALGDSTGARSDYTAGLRASRAVNDTNDATACLDGYAHAVAADDPAASVPYFNEAIAYAHRRGYLFAEANAYVGLAVVHGELGDARAEGDAFAQARRLFAAVGLVNADD